MSRRSNLDLINECDNFPYELAHSTKYNVADKTLFKFMVEGYDVPLGYMHFHIAMAFPQTGHWKIDGEERTFTFRPRSSDGSKVTDLEERNRILAKYLQGVRERENFGVLHGWRDELYPIYGPNRELILSMERSATPLFGVVTYGVHLTAFVRTPEGIKIWAPRRADTKQTYPGMMDNTVAGGLSTGEEPFNCLIRECGEEASLPEHVAKTAEGCGTVTYFHVRDGRAGGETGLLQPECQYVYDLELPEDVIPKPGDNEAVDFKLLSIPEVQEALAAGKFKPNCALLLLEFLIRHGYVTPENEPSYIEIVSRLHRKLEYPTR